MLNQYQPYSSMASTRMHTIAVFCMCVLACASSVVGSVNINGTLACSDVSAQYRVPINRTDTGSIFAISMRILSAGTLPAAMGVFANTSQMAQFNRYDPYSNTNIDIDSIQLNKDTQLLYYQPQPNMTEFYLSVYRLSYQKVQYSTNIDRVIQQYTGSNVNMINVCTMPIQYTIDILQYDHPLRENSGVVQPPLFASQCQYGEYDSSQCVCHQGIGMQLCDVYFQNIPADSYKVAAHIANNTSKYYYYQSQQSSGDQIMIIKVKGAISSEYSYSLNSHMPQFQILWHTQPISDKLKVSTIFNQYDPAGITGLILKSGHRLVITVYKPAWAHQQSYQIQVIKKSSNFDIIIRTLIISISVGIVICVLSFCVVYYYKRKFFQRHQEQLTANPHQVRFGINRIYNAYFSIDENFPTINFKEFNQVLRTLKGWEENNIQPGSNICSICLDPFESEEQQNVKITYCCHIFHNNCLTSWMKKQTSCPNCRTQFTKQEMTQIEQAAGTYLMNLESIDRYIKIWKWAKKIQDHQQSAQDPQIEYGTCHNLNIISQNDIK